jgi:glycerophosphoryl diester phosphodiesterase
MVDAAFMAKADRLGLTVHAWTVNTHAQMEILIDLNVNGVMTDDPDLLAGLLE